MTSGELRDFFWEKMWTPKKKRLEEMKVKMYMYIYYSIKIAYFYVF